MQDTQVWPLGWEDPLEKGMATHSSILVWRIPWAEEPGRIPSLGSQRVGHHWNDESVQFSLVAQSCPTLCDPMNCSTPGLPVHHQLPELIQTHIHWVGDAIQPCLILCHPLLLLSSIFPSIRVSLEKTSQLFAWGGQSTGVSASASVLPMNTQEWSPLGWTGWIFLQSKGLSRVFSNTIQKHQFFGAFFTVQLSHPYTTPGKTIALTRWTFVDCFLICYLRWSQLSFQGVRVF